MSASRAHSRVEPVAMELFDFRHVAIVVSRLRDAEEYYRHVFGMELIGREAEGDDGESYSLPSDREWDDAEAAGIELGFVALRRGEAILALLRGPASPGQVYAIGIVMSELDIAGIRARLPPHAEVVGDRPGYLEFVDPFGVRWQISTDRRFRMAGAIAGRWLAV